MMVTGPTEMKPLGSWLEYLQSMAIIPVVHLMSIASFAMDKPCTTLHWQLMVSCPMPYLPLYPLILTSAGKHTVNVNFNLVLDRLPSLPWKHSHQWMETFFTHQMGSSVFWNQHWFKCHTCGPPHYPVHCIHCWQLYWKLHWQSECNRDIIQKKYLRWQLIMSHVSCHCLEFWWRGWYECTTARIPTTQ